MVFFCNSVKYEIFENICKSDCCTHFELIAGANQLSLMAITFKIFPMKVVGTSQRKRPKFFIIKFFVVSVYIPQNGFSETSRFVQIGNFWKKSYVEFKAHNTCVTGRWLHDLSWSDFSSGSYDRSRCLYKRFSMG